MAKRSKGAEVKGEEIEIPIEFIEKVDRLIRSGRTLHSSREDFIRNAVEIKLLELRIPRSKASKK